MLPVKSIFIFIEMFDLGSSQVFVWELQLKVWLTVIVEVVYRVQ